MSVSPDPASTVWPTPWLGLSTPDPSLADALRTVFPVSCAPADGAPTLILDRSPDAPDVLTAEGLPWRRFRPAELIPVLESALTELVVQSAPRWFFLHAALLKRPDGRVILFAADRGHGKSTLSVELPRDHGWSYGGDDLAAFDPETRTWHPLPKAACLKAGTLSRHPEVERRSDPLRGDVGFLLPQTVHTEPVPLDHVEAIVFPDFSDAPERPTGVHPLPPHQLALGLIQQTCGGLERHPDSLKVIEALCHLPGFRLQHDSTATAAELLQELPQEEGA